MKLKKNVLFSAAGLLFVLGVSLVFGMCFPLAQVSFDGSGQIEPNGPAPNPQQPIFPKDGPKLGPPGDYIDLPPSLPIFDEPVLDVPDVDGTVYALAERNGVIYLGGQFTTCGGLPRKNIAAIDFATRSVTDWAPQVEGTVHAIEVTDAHAFVGGRFTVPGKRTLNNLACIDIDDDDAMPEFPAADAGVFALEMVGNDLYVGGAFRHLSGEWCPHLGRLSVKADGTADLADWNPALNGTVRDILMAADEAKDAGTLYVGGEFTKVGDDTRTALAAFDADGKVLLFAPEIDGKVYALTHWYWGGGVSFYLGGEFTTVNGQARQNLAAFEFTAPPTNENFTFYEWAPAPNGKVLGLDQVGVERIAVGDFTEFGGKTRKYIAAKGGAAWGPNAPMPKWNPKADAITHTVLSMPSISAVAVGGAFTTIGGYSFTGFAVLPAPQGKAPPQPFLQITVNGQPFGNGGTFDFGQISLEGGPSSPMTVEISNSGNDQMTYTIGGGNAEFDVGAVGTGGNIPVGGSISFDTTFDPATPGTKSSVISIGHDAPNQPTPFTINLAGEGVIPFSTAQYITPAMLTQGEPALQSSNATTVLAFTLGNLLSTKLELTEVALEFELVAGGPIGAGGLQAVVYIDKNMNGILEEEGFSTHVFGEAALTPKSDIPALTLGLPVQMTFGMEIQPSFIAEVQAGLVPELPVGGAINIGVEIWNVSAGGTVRVEFIEGATVPVEGGSPPVELVAAPATDVEDTPTFADEVPECDINCATEPWSLCLVPNLSWTTGNDTECPKDEITLTWNATCEVETVSFECDTMKLEEVGQEDISSNGMTVSQTFKPLKKSEACGDCTVTATVQYADEDAKVIKNADACSGTVFEVRVYPVLPNNGCVLDLENAIGNEVPDAFTYPENEAPPTVDDGDVGAPESRIDPDRTLDGNGGFGSAIDMLESMNPVPVIVPGFDENCLQSATVTLCSSTTVANNKAIAFHYTVLPTMENGSNCPGAPKLTISQFDVTGMTKGRTAIVVKKNFAPSSLGSPSQNDIADNLTGSGATTDIEDNPLDPSVGRDVTNIDPSTSPTGGKGTEERFIYLSPLPPNGGPPLEFCNIVLFSVACKEDMPGIPVAAIQLCALPALQLRMCFHFWENDGLSETQHTMLVDDFMARATVLLARCCIVPQVDFIDGKNHALITINGINLPEGLDGTGDLDIDGMNEATVASEIREERACDDPEVLNIFFFPKGITKSDTGGMTQTLLGGTFTAPNPPGLSSDVTIADADRFIIIPLGTEVNDGEEEASKNVYEGTNIRCTEVLSHEIAHALGIPHPDFMGVSDNEQKERIMRPTVDEDDFESPPKPGGESPPPNFRSPRAMRFTENECLTMRSHLGPGNNWIFNK
ncbi:MAG: hypothetical protein L6Q71_01575 [Planctomycetes bacterium]|nr:hypothetical protein [Planctomycetota bacterium]